MVQLSSTFALGIAKLTLLEPDFSQHPPIVC